MCIYVCVIVLGIGVGIDFWIIGHLTDWLIRSIIENIGNLGKTDDFCYWICKNDREKLVKNDESQSLLWKMYPRPMYVTDWVTDLSLS